MFAYVTPTVSVTLSDFRCSWEPLLIHKLMFQPIPPPFFLSQRGWIRHPVWFIWRREISVDSAYFMERTLTMPWRERRVWGGGGVGEGGGGVICLPGAHSLHSLQELWKCPLHTFCSFAELLHYARGDKTPLCAAAGSEVRRAMLSRGIGLTSLQCVNLYPTVTPDPVTKVQRRHQTSSGSNSAFAGNLKWAQGEKKSKLKLIQQKKLFIWDTHCQYKWRDHKTYTFQLFFRHGKQVLNWN